MKFPISWHEDCLKNQKRTLERAKELLEVRRIEMEKMERNIILYEAQIERAKAENKDGFDSEKFNKTKKAALNLPINRRK